MEPSEVLALAREHALAEAALDMDRVLATLGPVPVYEFFPSGLTFSGRANAEHFYRRQYPEFARSLAGAVLRDEWANRRCAVQEYVIDVRSDTGAIEAFHVISMMPVDDETGLLSGERLYCDERFVRALVGPLWDVLRPITA